METPGRTSPQVALAESQNIPQLDQVRSRPCGFPNLRSFGATFCRNSGDPVPRQPSSSIKTVYIILVRLMQRLNALTISTTYALQQRLCFLFVERCYLTVSFSLRPPPTIHSMRPNLVSANGNDSSTGRTAVQEQATNYCCTAVSNFFGHVLDDMFFSALGATTIPSAVPWTVEGTCVFDRLSSRWWPSMERLGRLISSHTPRSRCRFYHFIDVRLLVVCLFTRTLGLLAGLFLGWHGIIFQLFS